MQKILLGTGPLTWNRSERVGDRYGCVYTASTSSEEVPLDTANMFHETIKEHSGQKGKLIAEVIATRKSSHIGDLFHGFFPTTPSVGEEIELGEGTLFYEPGEYFAVGLKPDDNRATFWLIPQNLYRVHEQTVKLFFLPKGDI